uniref:Cation/H+ exchanger domain-containing protein n=1 Tax=Acrobeloides nanus TaxID=290746 RepID=A0A914C478_9BILA
MKRFGPEFNNAVINIVNHRETNLIVTSLIAFISLYIALVAVLDQNIIFSLQLSNDTGIEEPDELVNASYVTLGEGWIAEYDYALTIMSLFVLWLFALILGRIMYYIYLPPLLGMLLAGIAFRHVPFLSTWMTIDPSWDVVIRRIAFIIILIRCGISVDPNMLRSSLFISGNLGVGSGTFEVLAIVLASHFIYGFPVALAIVFGYVLAATSPAVIAPVMINFQENDRGTDKGVPTMVLVASSVDNLYCVTAFYMASSIVFTTADDLGYTITKILVELLLAAFLGIVFGLILRSFPRPDANLSHFTRAILVFFVSMALLFGCQAIKCNIAGPVAVLMLSLVASMRWKFDNVKRTRPEEHCFEIVWDLFFQPLLFGLIGLMFNFSLISGELFGTAMGIMFIGIAARIIYVFVVSFCSSLEIKEQGFLAFAFSPKGTFQATLGPLLAAYCLNHADYLSYTQTILQTCILSILITAPLGQLLLQGLGRLLLYKPLKGGISDPFRIGAPTLSEHTSPYITSPLRDNTLNIEVGSNITD